MSGHFVKIEPPFRSNTILKLLGRFTRDAKNPLVSSTPENPHEILGNADAEPVGETGEEETTLLQGASVQLIVGGFFKFEMKWDSSSNDAHTNSIFCTRNLRDYHDSFRTVGGDKAVQQKLREWGRRQVYMITGVKSVAHGEKGKWQVDGSDETGFTVTANAPVSEGLGLPGVPIDPEFGLKLYQKKTLRRDVTIDGEQVIAVELYKVEIQKEYIVWLGGYSERLWIAPFRRSGDLRVKFVDVRPPEHVRYLPDRELPKVDQRLVDVMFVGGLTQSPDKTWAGNWKTKFWPMWLPQEPGLQYIRISAFGYEAGKITDIGKEINDYAKSLLDALNDHHSKLTLVLSLRSVSVSLM